MSKLFDFLIENCRTISDKVFFAIMFASLELGKDDTAMQQQGLSLQKNPLFVSIVDGCETLKALVEKGKITPEIIAGCKGLILMRTDKVFMHAFCATMLNRTCDWLPAKLLFPADWLWYLRDPGLWLGVAAPAQFFFWLVRSFCCSNLGRWA